MVVRGTSRLPARAGAYLAVVLLAVGCGGGTDDGGSGGAASTAKAGAGGGLDLMPGATGGDGGTPTGTQPGVWPPPGFTNVTTTTIGAYALGPLLRVGPDGGTSTETGVATGATAGACGGLFAVVRDFKGGNRPGGHPDFGQQTRVADDVGIVANALGQDGKPVYEGAGRGGTTSGAANFDQWYRDVAGVNQTYVLALHLVQSGAVVSFQADSFFPLDEAGFGNETEPHNYGFTTEIRTSFTYNGGETFTFIGDDDVFVFINHQLVIDLGGVHAAKTGQVTLDDVSTRLALTKGNVYSLDVFHAERHPVESHFRIDTTLTLVDCGQLPPGVNLN
jgi:fibro-slime domain-containing protein